MGNESESLMVGTADARGVEALPLDSSYVQEIDRLRKLMQGDKAGPKVLRAKDIPWRINPQSILKNYIRSLDDQHPAVSRWTLFVHEIRTHSGSHRHQGGINIFILKGKGYTTVDGVRYDWGAGDLIMLPIKKGGVVHQHFNLENKPSRWVAIENKKVADLVGGFMEQKESSPQWNSRQKNSR